jgi:hypothetical protein
MALFQPRDDNTFIAWLDANPNGYVINTELLALECRDPGVKISLPKYFLT